MTNQPRTGVSALLIQDKKVLLIKRGKEPSKGLWALPGGKQELGETLQQAIVREIKEETNLDILDPTLLTLYEPIIRSDKNEVIAHFVIAVFTSDEISGNANAGDDAADFTWANKSDLKKLQITDGSNSIINTYGEDKIT